MSCPRWIALGVASLVAAPCLATEPIPAEPPIGGIWWSVVVPALLLVLAFGATLLLYRHFGGRAPGE